MAEIIDHRASGTDVTDILTADHKEMLDLVNQIKRTSEPSQRRELTDTLIAEVMRHSVAEEMHVYPAIKTHVPSGVDEVEHDKQEHDQIVQVMREMESVDVSEADFTAQIDKLEDLLRHHANDEESEQFPKLRANVVGEKLVELGEKVQDAKRLAPTRPHPSAPHSELFHKSVGPGVGMVDRLRDKLQGRTTR
ncbi:hemerythrin domain-containing protein [Litchfieldella xinjiangensis]|uniref:hemerythrin domain-containing protein n=1 Tax=Litchfieldella xinjiangensis TaxID=1166948 RepID=UPI0005BACBAC|nr:hemerythrin domain-containing protein [Halomonas xinjiangensis]